MSRKNHVCVRQFKASDLRVVESLIHDTIDSWYVRTYPKEAVQFFKDWHCSDRILKDAQVGYTIVLEHDGRVVGTGTIVDDSIMRVFVDPAYQKQGLGKLIMGMLEEKAISNGIETVNPHFPSGG